MKKRKMIPDNLEPAQRSTALWRFSLLLLPLAAVLVLSGQTAMGEPELGLPEGPAPDVIVGELQSLETWGTVGNITAYSVGTTSCNAGNANLDWIANSNRHPVIGQNMYRLKDGRMEQIGMSWLKHGFTALAQDACGFGCQSPGSGSLLGVGCSDPYGAGLNGDQQGFGVGGLGPRFEVNAVTGGYNYPYAFQGDGGNAIFKRLQVANDDVNPALNSGARYFVEGQYITPDDALANNDNNNASYREVSVAAGNFEISFNGSFTQREKAAIIAWQDIDPTVAITHIDVTDDGRFTLARKVSDNGNGTWRYEYALYNMNSHQSARSFSVPVSAGVVVSNIGFHDVDYHSGEPFAGTDWTSSTAGNAVTWSTQTFATNANANALRWGTTYNFWFDANSPPGDVVGVVGLFRPGTTSAANVVTMGPSNGVFSDAFESGDTTAWSDTVP